MFGYMTDLETVEVQKTEEVTAEGEPWAQMYARNLIIAINQTFNNDTSSQL